MEGEERRGCGDWSPIGPRSRLRLIAAAPRPCPGPAACCRGEGAEGWQQFLPLAISVRLAHPQPAPDPMGPPAGPVMPDPGGYDTLHNNVMGAWGGRAGGGGEED